MSEIFRGEVVLESNDIKRLLEPSVFYVGATFSDDCQMDRFINRGIWENGHDDDVQRYVERFEKMKKGDFIVIKRLNGKAATTMRILAIGICLGRISSKDCNVAWIRKNLKMEVPLVEIGTISQPKDILNEDEVHPELRDTIERARIRFLRTHLNKITLTNY